MATNGIIKLQETPSKWEPSKEKKKFQTKHVRLLRCSQTLLTNLKATVLKKLLGLTHSFYRIIDSFSLLKTQRYKGNAAQLGELTVQRNECINQ